MQIIDMPIEELIPYESNPRRNDISIGPVENSIREFGFKVPIIIDGDNVIVAGHTRLAAAKRVGLDTVPCLIANDLTKQQIKAFRLADNKVSELSTWDFSMLGSELGSVLDIDMDRFGFTDDFIDHDMSAGKSGASPWDRMNSASESSGVLFSFGDVQCKLPASVYDSFKENIGDGDAKQWLVQTLASPF